MTILLVKARKKEYTGENEKHFQRSDMERHGFIKDMLDVKVLILYVMSRVEFPVSVQTVYALCLQDDRLTYFDVCEAVPQLVTTGHLQAVGENLFEITESGREMNAIMQETVAVPVAQRAKKAVEEYNLNARRDNLIRTAVTEQDDGMCSVRMELSDGSSPLMALELTAPSLSQARKLEKRFRRKAEHVYQKVMQEFLEREEEPIV